MFGRFSGGGQMPSFFGGPVEPWFEGAPPRWLEKSLAAGRQRIRGAAARETQHSSSITDRLPYGANFAIKTTVQREYPLRYRPSGPEPGSEVRGEETEIIRRMLGAGHTGWWVPDAKLKHFIPRHRQSLSYLRRFFVGQGEVQSRLFGGTEVPRIFGRPRWLLRRALAAEAHYRWSRVTASPDIWLDRLIEAATAWGHLKAAP